MTVPADRPVLLFDGDCGFCTTSANLARRIVPEVDVVPYQHADLLALGVTAEACATELHLVDPQGGAVSRGADAVARTFLAAGLPWSVAGRALLVPGVRQLAQWAYRLVAANRFRLPGGTPACRLDQGVDLKDAS